MFMHRPGFAGQSGLFSTSLHFPRPSESFPNIYSHVRLEVKTSFQHCLTFYLSPNWSKRVFQLPQINLMSDIITDRLFSFLSKAQCQNASVSHRGFDPFSAEHPVLTHPVHQNSSATRWLEPNFRSDVWHFNSCGNLAYLLALDRPPLNLSRTQPGLDKKKKNCPRRIP